jgi:hypothetical protein
VSPHLGVLEFYQAANIESFMWWQMEAASLWRSMAEIVACGCLFEKRTFFIFSKGYMKPL